MQKKIILHVTNLDCSACVVLLDGELEDMKGVSQAKTNYAASKTEISYDPEKVTPKKIISVIKKTGYDASVVTS